MSTFPVSVNDAKREFEGPSLKRYVVFFSGMLAISGMAMLISSYSREPSHSSSTMELNQFAEITTVGIMYSSLSSTEKKMLFEEFKTKYGREYVSTKEEEEKYSNFETFLKLVDERNVAEAAAGGGAEHGITKFADISDDEFRANFLGFRLDEDLETILSKGKNGDSRGGRKSSDTVVDWSDTYTTAVKNQGYCGSCWAFSATEQIESDAIRAGYLDTSVALSPQQLVSCDTYDHGCDGGIPVYAYYYVYKTGGLQENSTYPYTSYYDVTGTCDSDSDDFVIGVSEFYYLSTEDAMETHVLDVGPLSVCVDASNWASYTNGTLSTCGTSVDHCVQIVGYNGDESYWKIRNSWGTDWGLDGYIYIESGVNLCDITYIPTYTSVDEV